MSNLGSKITSERTAETKCITRSGIKEQENIFHTHLVPAFHSLVILFGVFGLHPMLPQYPLKIVSDNESNFQGPEEPESPFPVPEEWLDADESEDEDG